jgi:outer membrane protein assembly factor BamA
VEFTPFVNTRTGEKQHVYAVKDAGDVLKVCALRIEGAAAVSEAELKDAASLVGTDYSRSFTVGLSSGTLRQIYRRRGFWKAEFAPPIAALNQAACAGTSVTLRVSEGPAYLWDHAEWSGQSVLTTKDLDARLGLKPGEVADVGKIEAGLRLVHSAYEVQGYLNQTVKFEPRLDDAARRATFAFTVAEGPQFRMGTLELVGFAPRDEANLRKKWKIQSGDVYDASYLTVFIREAVAPIMGTGTARRTVSPQTQVDQRARVVNVRIVAGAGEGSVTSTARPSAWRPDRHP